MSGGASASAGTQSGTKTETLDPETLAFRNNLFNRFNSLTGNIPGFGGDGTGTFIAPQSADTQKFYELIRGMQGGTNPNSGGINQFGADVVSGRNDITGGDVANSDIQGGNAYAGRIGVGGMTPAYNDYYGGYEAAQAGQVGRARDLTGYGSSNPYMSQYLTNVIDPSLAEFDYKSGVGLQNLRAGRGADTAFGSRAGNADAVYQAQSDRDRALLASGLRKDAYQTATGYGMSDADRLVANDRQAQALEAARLEANAGRTDNANKYAVDRRYEVGQSNVGINNAGQMFNINSAIDQQKYNTDADYRTQVDNLTRSIGVQDSNRTSRMTNDTANINRSIGVQQQNIVNKTTGANLLSGQDQSDFQRTLTQLGLLGQSGTDQTNFDQRRASEPLDILQMAGSLLAGVPYGGTTTQSGKSKSKSGSVTG